MKAPMKLILVWSLSFLALSAQAFEFSACDDKTNSPNSLRSPLTSHRGSFCKDRLQRFDPSLVSNFYASDLKQSFNCHLAFELEENLKQLAQLTSCLEESRKNDASCKHSRELLDRQTNEAYATALRALVQAEPYIDRDRWGSSAFRLDSEHSSEIGTISVTRTPKQRVASLIDEHVSVKAGLGSLSFEGVNLDQILQSMGLDIGVIGGFQSIPKLPTTLVREQRDSFVGFVSDILMACDDLQEVEAQSFDTLTPAFMHKAARCEQSVVQPLLEFRQAQALSRYFETVAHYPQIAYLDVRSLPLKLNSKSDAQSRRLLRDAFAQVEKNILRLQKILLENKVDYTLESALLPAMNAFISKGNQHFCPQAEQLLRLRPVASVGMQIKRLFFNQLAYSSCYGAASVLGSPVGGSVTCPVVIEGAKAALEAERSLRLSQALTVYSDNEDLMDGITNSDVLRSADARFVDAVGRFMNVPKEVILKMLTGPLEDALAAELVKKGHIPPVRTGNGLTDQRATLKRAKKFVRGLRRISEI